MMFYGREFISVDPDEHLGTVLKSFQTGRTRIAIVRAVLSVDDKDPTYVTAGLITLEDILEEILRDEIKDETELRITDNNFKQNTKIQRLTPQQVIAVGSFLTKTFEIFEYLPDEKLFHLLGLSALESFEPKEKDPVYPYEQGKEYSF